MNIAKLMSCYYTGPVENNERTGLLTKPYDKAWRTWEKQAAHGSGEMRQIAISLLEECVENEDHRLSLASLKLSSLPPCLPNFLEILDIHDNNLESLPNDLPLHLLKLDVGHNRLKKISLWRLTELRELNAANNKLHRLSKHFPDSLEIIDVQNNRITYLPHNRPLSLCTLRINNNPVNELPAAWAAQRADAISPGASPVVSAARRREPGEHTGETAASLSAVPPDAASINPRRKRSRLDWWMTLSAECVSRFHKFFYR